MTIPFSKTTHQLQTDRFSVRLVILLCLIVLLAVWSVWFTTAQISLWSHSTSANFRTTNSIEAQFPAEDYFLLQVGQPARLVLNENSHQAPIYLSAEITDIDPQAEQLAVRLVVTESSIGRSFDLQPGLTGRIEIETAQRTPFQLLLQYLRLRSTTISR